MWSRLRLQAGLVLRSRDPFRFGAVQPARNVGWSATMHDARLTAVRRCRQGKKMLTTTWKRRCGLTGSIAAVLLSATGVSFAAASIPYSYFTFSTRSSGSAYWPTYSAAYGCNPNTFNGSSGEGYYTSASWASESTGHPGFVQITK